AFYGRSAQQDIRFRFCFSDADEKARAKEPSARDEVKEAAWLRERHFFDSAYSQLSCVWQVCPRGPRARQRGRVVRSWCSVPAPHRCTPLPLAIPISLCR